MNKAQNKIQALLLVDDDQITNYLNKRLLEKLDIAKEITVAMNGKEGIKCLEDHCFRTQTSPEVILLDINMPVMDGFEFIKTFKTLKFQNKENVTIAVLTTSTHPEDREKMKDMGVSHFISKPLTVEKINRLMECI